MTWLLGSIACYSLIFIVFRFAGQKGMAMAPMLFVNYVVSFVFSLILTKNWPQPEWWMLSSALLGFLIYGGFSGDCPFHQFRRCRFNGHGIEAQHDMAYSCL